MYSPKHPDRLQHPPSLQLNENQSYISDSKVASADSLTTHIHLQPSLKLSGVIPPLVSLHGTYWDNLILPLPPTCVHISREVTSFLVL